MNLLETIMTIISILIALGALLVAYLSMRSATNMNYQSMSREDHQQFEIRLRNVEIKTSVVDSHISDVDKNISAQLNAIIRELDGLHRKSYTNER